MHMLLASIATEEEANGLQKWDVHVSSWLLLCRYVLLDWLSRKNRREHELLPPTIRPQLTVHFALTSNQELDKLAEGLVPENTAKITNWALKQFKAVDVR